MSASNGKPASPPPTMKLAAWSRLASGAPTRLAGWPPPVKIACVLLLLVLATLCMGCATPSPPEISPRNPAPPRLSEPLPQESYSEKALRLIESWRNAVTGM